MQNFGARPPQERHNIVVLKTYKHGAEFWPKGAEKSVVCTQAFLQGMIAGKYWKLDIPTPEDLNPDDDLGFI